MFLPFFLLFLSLLPHTRYNAEVKPRIFFLVVDTAAPA
jgi:hypothetical protein